jgi:hypothetical protein
MSSSTKSLFILNHRCTQGRGEGERGGGGEGGGGEGGGGEGGGGEGGREVYLRKIVT